MSKRGQAAENMGNTILKWFVGTNTSGTEKYLYSEETTERVTKMKGGTAMSNLLPLGQPPGSWIQIFPFLLGARVCGSPNNHISSSDKGSTIFCEVSWIKNMAMGNFLMPQQKK